MTDANVEVILFEAGNTFDDASREGGTDDMLKVARSSYISCILNNTGVVVCLSWVFMFLTICLWKPITYG